MNCELCPLKRSSIHNSRPDPFSLFVAPVAGGEGAEGEGADAEADELLNGVAEDRAHATDLALAAFGEDELEPRALGGGTQGRLEESCGGGTGDPTPTEIHAVGEHLEGLGIGTTADAGVVGPGHVVLRVGEAAGEGRVVGEEKEPGGVSVEAAHREHPAIQVPEAVVHGGAPRGVHPGGEETHGLVKGDDHALEPGADPEAVDEDDVAGGVHGRARRAHLAVIDGDPTSGDPALGLAARADPELREGAAKRPRTRRTQPASGRLPRANVIWPSHTTFPSTRAWPRRVPILLRRRTTSPSRRSWSPAITGRR